MTNFDFLPTQKRLKACDSNAPDALISGRIGNLLGSTVYNDSFGHSYYSCPLVVLLGDEKPMLSRTLFAETT